MPDRFVIARMKEKIEPALRLVEEDGEGGISNDSIRKLFACAFGMPDRYDTIVLETSPLRINNRTANYVGLHNSSNPGISLATDNALFNLARTLGIRSYTPDIRGRKIDRDKLNEVLKPLLEAKIEGITPAIAELFNPPSGGEHSPFEVAPII